MNKIKIHWQQTAKQRKAWECLMDDSTTEVFFGGGAGGGKSFEGCAWIIIMCGKYPGTRWLIGRKELKTLKRTTLKTFFEICGAWNIKKDVHFKYNMIDNSITWNNGSEILLYDLAHKPSDPNYDELGSLEITGAFVDEVPEITHRAWELLNSRIRFKLDEYNLIPKALGTCNPNKGWVYNEVYRGYCECSLCKRYTLPDHVQFVQALAKDNPFIAKSYIENLKRMKSKIDKERLLFGDWHYADNENSLFDVDSIYDLFTNKGTDGEKYLIGDVARKGKR